MATKAQLDHARSMELRTAVLSMLDQFAPDGVTLDTYFEAYTLAAFVKSAGMDNDNAALFGVVQTVL